MPTIDPRVTSVYASGVPLKRIKHLIGRPHQEVVKGLEQFGQKYVRRYKIWRKYLDQTRDRKLKEPLVVVVAGLPSTGKTTIADAIAKRLGIKVRFPGDMGRQFLRSYLDKDQHPVVFVSVYDAWKFYGKEPTKEAIIKGHEEQSRVMNKGIGNIIDRAIKDGENTLIEYLHFLPHTFEEGQISNQNVIPIVLHIGDVEKHKERVRLRDRFEHIKSDPERLIANLDKYRVMQDHVIERAREHNVAVIENVEFDRTVEQALDVVVNRVEEIMKSKGIEWDI